MPKLNKTQRQELAYNKMLDRHEYYYNLLKHCKNDNYRRYLQRKYDNTDPMRRYRLTDKEKNNNNKKKKNDNIVIKDNDRYEILSDSDSD